MGMYLARKEVVKRAQQDKGGGMFRPQVDLHAATQTNYKKGGKKCLPTRSG
jgi:hypothetical protein